MTAPAKPTEPGAPAVGDRIAASTEAVRPAASAGWSIGTSILRDVAQAAIVTSARYEAVAAERP
jgi:hypothetical protein